MQQGAEGSNYFNLQLAPKVLQEEKEKEGGREGEGATGGEGDTGKKFLFFSFFLPPSPPLVLAG